MVNTFIAAETITGSDDPHCIQLQTEPAGDCDHYNESHLETDLSAVP